MDTWHDATSLKAAWKDLPSAQLGTDLLEASQSACERHLVSEGLPVPAGDEDDPVPAEYRYAQLLQARALFNAGRVNAGDETLGGDGYAIRVVPMGKQIKDLLGYGGLGIG